MRWKRTFTIKIGIAFLCDFMSHLMLSEQVVFSFVLSGYFRIHVDLCVLSIFHMTEEKCLLCHIAIITSSLCVVDKIYLPLNMPIGSCTCCFPTFFFLSLIAMSDCLRNRFVQKRFRCRQMIYSLRVYVASISRLCDGKAFRSAPSNLMREYRRREKNSSFRTTRRSFLFSLLVN